MDSRDWKIVVPQEVRDSVDSEALAAVTAAFRAKLSEGGIKGLMAASQEVVWISNPDSPCPVCGASLIPEDGWPGEFLCTGTCKEYAFILSDSA